MHEVATRSPTSSDRCGRAMRSTRRRRFPFNDEERSVVMRRIATAAAVALLVLGPVGSTLAQGRHDQMPHGVASAQKAPSPDAAGATAGDQVVALNDGGTLVLRKDGIVYHATAAGRRVRMKNGRVMEGRDETRYLMKNDAVWQQISKSATLPLSHP